MALLQVNNLVKFYGSAQILSGLNLEVNLGEKWGLIGKNGCGKTTLMRILTGSEDYDQGEIHWAQNTRIGYLQQEPEFYATTLYQELRLVFAELDQLQERINHIQQKMDEPALSNSQLENLIAEFAHLNEVFEERGGFQVEGRIQGVLRGLGFPRERWNDSPWQLSGGERTRLAMARILLTSNDILFLDEPTNYLDLAAIEWLEGYLADYRGAIVLISHDRYFLDKVVQGFYEIEQGAATRFRGNYTAFRDYKLNQYEANLKAYLKQEKELTRLEKFVRESRATEKSKRKAHSIEKRLEKVERIDRPVQDRKRIKLDFKAEVASAKKVLEVEGITKAFVSKNVLNGIDFSVYSGDKIGLIGPNGVGKTTLLKIILGFDQPDRGLVRL
ncbi:MAG TPA: ABC-F family ATP-binding cassette domain-containing protein, partial [Bacillota bacterium]|nr:ABC-F family ATP-binding cassette domain-containing protein [Bacillota bacterium]